MTNLTSMIYDSSLYENLTSARIALCKYPLSNKSNKSNKQKIRDNKWEKRHITKRFPIP